MSDDEVCYMLVYKVWCEWDMDWNVGEYVSVYRTRESMAKVLESKDWDDVGYPSWEHAEADGMLDITTIEVV